MTLQWQRESEKWLRSECFKFKISYNQALSGEHRYTAYLWWSAFDWGPIVLDTVSTEREAKALCAQTEIYGGSP